MDSGVPWVLRPAKMKSKTLFDLLVASGENFESILFRPDATTEFIPVTLVPRLCLGTHCLQGSAFPLHATVFATTQTYILSPRLHLASRPCVSDNAHFSNKLEDNRPKRVDLALYRVRRRSLADSAFPGGAWERGEGSCREYVSHIAIGQSYSLKIDTRFQ